MKTSVNDIPDDQILALLKEQVSYEKGFRLLMQKYQERLYWQVRRMVFEHDDANDVIQNVFIKVFKSINRFEGKSSLYTWLYRVATNESITFLNKKKRKTAASLDDEEHNLSNQLKADPYFDGDEAQRLLQQALQQLPDKQRLVFNMRYYDELSYQEISDILETSVGGLKASYHHAVKKIERFFRGAELNQRG
ncbi:MAG: sigma-70 family RNA polymerase sigma factor [Bacteroidota bacterium]